VAALSRAGGGHATGGARHATNALVAAFRHLIILFQGTLPSREK